MNSLRTVLSETVATELIWHDNSAIAVVGYHRTNIVITVFYSVLRCLSGHCFLKTAPHYSAEQ